MSSSSSSSSPPASPSPTASSPATSLPSPVPSLVLGLGTPSPRSSPCPSPRRCPQPYEPNDDIERDDIRDDIERDDIRSNESEESARQISRFTPQEQQIRRDAVRRRQQRSRRQTVSLFSLVLRVRASVFPFLTPLESSTPLDIVLDPRTRKKASSKAQSSEPARYRSIEYSFSKSSALDEFRHVSHAKPRSAKHPR